MKTKMVKYTSPNSEADQLITPVIQCFIDTLESYIVSTLRYVFKIFLFFLTRLGDAIRDDFEDVVASMKEPFGFVNRIRRTPAKNQIKREDKFASTKSSVPKRMSVRDVKEAMGKLLATDLEGEEEFEEEVSLQEVREAFEVFDENKDGFIDAGEVQHVLRSLGVMEASRVECKEMIKAFDNDGDGKIDFNEFTGIVEDSFR